MNQSQALNDYIDHDCIMALAARPQRSRLLNTAIVEKIDSEQTIFVTGNTTDYLYYLIEGKVSLSRGTTKSNKIIETIEKGQYFGLDTVIQIQFHTQTALTIQPSVIIKIPTASLKLLMDDNAQIARYLLRLAIDIKLNIVPDKMKNQFCEKFDLVSIKIIYQWLLAIGLPSVLYTVLQFLNLDKSLSIFCCTGLLSTITWTLNLMPAYAASMFMLIVILTTGIVPTSVALSGFASESFVILFCLYGIVGAMQTSGLMHRIVLLALKYLPSSQWWINMFMFVTGIFLTAVVPEATNRHKLTLSILTDLINFTRLKPGSPAVTHLVISNFIGTSILSTIFYHGSIYNFLLLGMLWPQDQQRFRWDGWLEAAVVPGILMFIIQSIIISLTCYKSAKLDLDRPRIELQNSVYGRLTIEEWVIICAIPFLIIGLSTTNFHHMTALSIYLLMFMILTFIPFKPNKSPDNTVNWQPLLLYAALSGIVMAEQYLHINSFIVQNLGWLGICIKNNFTSFILILSGFSALIRLCLPYGPTVILLASILIPIAQANEINSWLMSFICLTTANMWFFAYQNPLYQDLKAHLQHSVLFDAQTILFRNMMLNICTVMTLLISQYYWIRLGFL